MGNYTIYHLHSDMSNGVINIDSVTKYQNYIERAKECGMSALGFSEHGSVFAWDLKKEDIEKAGMKYIHAEEFYLTETLDEKVRDNYHCVLIAKNIKGVKELNLLSTKSFNRSDNHFYYAPRITIDDVINTSDNIIITSACLGGPLNHGTNNVQGKFLKFFCEHKDRCFLEVQHHNVGDQIAYNRKLYRISLETGIRLIAGTDTHSLNEEKAEGRSVLQRGKDIFFGDEEGWDLTFKTYDELVEAYHKQNSIPEQAYMEAIENTNIMADMIEPFEIDRHTKYPKIYKDPEKTFKQKINDGYKNNKYLHERYTKEEVVSRIKEEFEVYKKVGAIDFMLLESYIREWERNNGVQSGYSRGSVSGSLIAYALGITQMDSLKFHLNFFRFMNPSRVTNADIDTDYCSKDRDKIKYFLLHDKMDLLDINPNIRTAEIITFNTVDTKGAVKDICRALYRKDKEDKEYLTISDSISKSIDAGREEEMRKQYPDVFKYVDIISGTIVSIGTHPSGVLVSDRNIEEDIGLCSIATSSYPVSMLDMHGLDGQMYVKLDILGLDNIGVINEACKLAGIERLTPDNVDLNDEKVWKDIRDDTTMIFQWESSSAQSYLKKFMSDETIKIAKEHNKDFSYIKWFSFGNGLIRPGCASFRDDVANGDILITGFKELDEFLAITFGRVTMQEDIMRFCKQFCGYNDAESDNVRRAIAKKKGTAGLLDELHDRFLEYSNKTYGVDKNKLEEIFPPIKQGILDASAYAFSWNHSDAYSCIGYISGYLRYYYPFEFLTAAFNIFTGKQDKITAITNYAKKFGITIRDIQFGHSKADYSFDKENKFIYKGMESIKYLNADVSDKLYELSQTKQYNSFVEILKDFPGDSRQLDILIKLGYFSDFGSIGKLLKIVEIYNQYGSKTIIKKDQCAIDKDIMLQYATETEKQYRLKDKDGFINYLLGDITYKEYPITQRIKDEKEYLGYVSLKIEGKSSTWYVTDINTKYSPKVSLYNVGTGEEKVVKIEKRKYQMAPFDKDVCLRATFEMKNKCKKDENGDWVKLEEKEEWIKYYSVV